MKSVVVAFLILVILGSGAVVGYGVVQMRKPPPAPPVAKKVEAPKEDPAVVKERLFKETAEAEAKQMMKRLMKLPTTAGLTSALMLEHKGKFALVHILSDSAALRGSYCLVLRVDDPSPGHFTWSPPSADGRTAPLRPCADPPTDAQTTALEGANHWPGVAPPPKPAQARRPGKKSAPAAVAPPPPPAVEAPEQTETDEIPRDVLGKERKGD